MTVASVPALADGLAAVLRGERVPWAALGVGAEELVAACAEEDLTGLVQRGLPAAAADWPPDAREAITGAARAAAAEELVKGREVAAVLDALAAAGLAPVLFKGTPLAYTVYESPALRPRGDTDLLIAPEQRDAARRVMAAAGYAATNYSDGELLFRQFEFSRVDALGVSHAFDVHWKVSAQAAFAELLTYGELAAAATAIPALGAHARGAAPVHALLLACVHPVMHHRNAERLIWLYDIHALVGRLPAGGLEAFAALAARKGVAAICAHQLGLARTRLGTDVPPGLIAALGARGAAGEPTAAWLAPGRRWGDELAANLGDLPRWRDRLRLLREIALPAPRYMLKAYGLDDARIGRALLPALYVHRGVRGVWRVLRGAK